MDVTLTDEQVQWQDAVARLASANAVTNPSQVTHDDDGNAGWASAVELGIPALRAPSLSGVEAAGVESTIAVEQLARHLAPLPVVGQGVVAPQLLEAAGATELLTAVAEGTARIAPALRRDLTGFAAPGEPAIAFDSAGASHALLLDGPSLVAVPITDAPIEGLDLTRRLHPLAAAATPADLPLGTPIPEDRLARATAVALTAFSADLLGVMQGALDDAVQYAKDRRQFATPIGTFQAVQHLLADALVAVEGTRSCVWHAAWALDHLDADEAMLAARTAKAYAAAAGRKVVETSVQVFGGIAITWEQLSHVRLRRMHLDRACLGDEHLQYQAIAASRLAEAVA